MLHAMILAAAALVAHAQDTKPADRARANLGSYFSTDDYPAGAIRRGAEGTVRFELEIGTDGRVSRCSVSSSSGDADLDATTCAILSSRASYTPARDAEGRPTVGSDRGSVAWRLPDAEGSAFPPFVPLQFTGTVHRDAAGALICTFALNGRQMAPPDVRQCGFLAVAGVEAAVQALSTGRKLTLTLMILPDGSTASAGLAPDGQIVFDTRAEIVVAPDGSIGECRTVEARLAMPLPGLISSPDLCALYSPNGRQAFMAGPGSRRGQVRSTLHLKTGEHSPDP